MSKYDWDYDMSEAPNGRVVQETISRGEKIIIQSRFIPEPCHVLLNGKVYQTWRLQDGRWNGFTKEQVGDAWFPYPTPPAKHCETKLSDATET